MSCYDSQGNELPMLGPERRKEEWLDSIDYWINEFNLITECIEDKWVPLLISKVYLNTRCSLCIEHTNFTLPNCAECCIIRLNNKFFSCYDTPCKDVVYGNKLSIKNEIRFLLETRRKVIGEIPMERRTDSMEKVMREKVEETLECNECYETWNALGTWTRAEFILTDEDDEVCPHCGDEFYSVLHVKG